MILSLEEIMKILNNLADDTSCDRVCNLYPPYKHCKGCGARSLLYEATEYLGMRLRYILKSKDYGGKWI